MRLLLVAATYSLSYRVLRCARECNAEVYVLGNLGARSLALSRHCAKFVLSHTIINGSYDEDLAIEINCLARELDIAMVLPGDAAGTRALIACRHLLEPPVFPLPDLEQFDLLNDKWRFAQICDKLGMRRPATRLVPDSDTLEAEFASGCVTFPAVVKARNLSGSQGQIILRGGDDIALLKRVNYRPILVQEFVSGHDICAAAWCRSGRVIAFVGYENRKRVHSTFQNEAICGDIGGIASYFNLNGMFCFDMIAGEDGNAYYLECNPRFYFSMNLSMLAGINFVTLGLPDNAAFCPPPVPHGTIVHWPEAVMVSPRSWWQLTRRDWAATRYALSDPILYVLEQLGWLV